MKTRTLNPSTLVRWSAPVALALVIAWCTGCSSTSSEAKSSPPAATGKAESTDKAAKAAPPLAQGLTKEAVLAHEDVKGKDPTVFNQPLDKTREAALRSLTFVGCEVKQNEQYYVAGRRPNKFGLFVGSGGETVEVFLYPKSENETQVWVDTDMSFVGIAGQQGWNEQVLAEMRRITSNQAQAK